MRDIYEMFNDVHIDATKYEDIEIDFSDIEKKKLINNFRKKYKSKKFLSNFNKRAKIAGIAIILVSTIFVSSNPTFAKNIPIIGGMIKYLENGSNLTFINENYSKFKENVSLEANDSNINFKINSVAYDGAYLYFTYEINTHKILKPNIDANIDGIKLLINNKPINISQKLSEKNNLDGSYKVYDNEIVYSYDCMKSSNKSVSNENKDKIFSGITRINLSEYKFKNDLNINLNINNISGIKGKWNFKFQVSKKDLLNKTKKVEILGDIKINDKIKLKLDNIIITPMGTTIESTIIADKGAFKDKIIDKKSTSLMNNYVILTDKGEELFPKMYKPIPKQNIDGKEVFKAYTRFTAPKEMPKEIKIIPIIQTKDDDNIDIFMRTSKDYEWIKVSDLKKDMEISQGESKSIKINSVDRDNKILKLNVLFNGIDILRRNEIFLVKDKNKFVSLVNNTKSKKEELELAEIVEEPNHKFLNNFEKIYDVKGTDYTFNNCSEDDYILIPKYYTFLKEDKENIKVINLSN